MPVNFGRVDRQMQTAARAKPARPLSGVAKSTPLQTDAPAEPARPGRGIACDAVEEAAPALPERPLTTRRKRTP